MSIDHSMLTAARFYKKEAPRIIKGASHIVVHIPLVVVVVVIILLLLTAMIKFCITPSSRSLSSDVSTHCVIGYISYSLRIQLFMFFDYGNVK